MTAVDQPDLGPLLGLVGTWEGDGDGRYPTIQPFGYQEVLEVALVPGKPQLTWTSRTSHADDGRPLHGERGFLRAVGGDQVELVVAQGPGILEASAGTVAEGRLTLASTAVVGTPTAKRVGEVRRQLRWNGDFLTYDLSMATAGQPLLPHLHASLRRRDG